ncbi:MAG: glycoside hydrolase family 2 [Candidatus Rokubacteria bacterium]|nr:glycoside hydrolase family 2 [Candidatus Rokubacteria bacterium]
MQRIELKDGWLIQSSRTVTDEGGRISTVNYAPSNWYPTAVPSTVLAALVENRVYRDIFFSRNFEKIPTEPFEVPWWYRTTFDLPQTGPEQIVRLRFDGINFRAEVWVNGVKIAASDTAAGAFRRFAFDITRVVRPGTNGLAVQVTAPKPGEPTLGFVDWNPPSPDRQMGLWRNVTVEVTGPVTVEEPFIQTQVDTVTLDRAEITISAVVQNHTPHPVSGILKGAIGAITFQAPIQLAARGVAPVTFTPQEFLQLRLDHPRLWWTHDLGQPNLYTLDLAFIADGRVSDQRSIQFGIRTVSEYINDQGFRGYMLNGKKVLVKGGGWTDPLLLNATSEYERAQIEYVRHMNLNAVRMEGFWGRGQHLYDLCDELGVLIMAGWSAQWEWDEVFGAPTDDFGGIRTPEQMELVAESWKDQIVWLRNHPSIFLWVYASDKLPRPALEQRYLAILRRYDPTRPYLAAAKEQTSALSGPTSVKMRGPYDYVPPNYWYLDTRAGGAFGFNTESSPGPAIPVLESLRQMIPVESLWPINDIWLYHAARGPFHNLTRYNQAMERRLGKPQDLQDYLRKAQYLNYEGMRAMFEAFSANRYRSTGIIQWMLNAAWPKLWWQLFDYSLSPTGAFYGARKANSPLHIAYNYGRHGIDVINQTVTDAKSLSAVVSVYDADLTPRLVKTIPLPVLPANQASQVFRLPENLELSKTYFLDVRLRDERDAVISANFYVLSTQQDVLDVEHSTWYVTPQSQYADLTRLNDLPKVKLTVGQDVKQAGNRTLIHVTLKNPSEKLAFMVHLDLRGETGNRAVLPVCWDDNYVTLLPGEERVIHGYCYTRDLQGENPKVVITGWNVE